MHNPEKLVKSSPNSSAVQTKKRTPTRAIPAHIIWQSPTNWANPGYVNSDLCRTE